MLPLGAEVNFSNVTKEFSLKRGEIVQALDNINLNVPPGQFLSILGPSGCGKSTILRMIAALEEPTSGSVTIETEPPLKLAAQHRLGVAFQDHALLPWLSVRDNIALPFKVARQQADWGRVEELIEIVGLRGFEGARPRQLSGGMRQRVSIARALVLRPALLLLDEPFGALDEVTRRRLNMELQAIWSELRITTVLVTHSVEEAILLGERVIVMSQRPGSIVIDEAVPYGYPRTRELLQESAFHKMADRFVAALDQEVVGI